MKNNQIENQTANVGQLNLSGSLKLKQNENNKWTSSIRFILAFIALFFQRVISIFRRSKKTQNYSFIQESQNNEIPSQSQFVINQWDNSISNHDPQEDNISNNNLVFDGLLEEVDIEKKRIQSPNKNQLPFKNNQAATVPLQKIDTFITFEPSKLTQIKILDLSSAKMSDKISSKSMQNLIKLQLPNVVSVNLKNNRICDQGVEVLCHGKFQNLTEIQLNNNGISVNGVSHLINNNWNDKVTYKLDTVKTNHGGFVFKVGQNMPTMKTLIKHTAKTIDAAIQMLSATNHSNFCHAIDLMLQIPLTGDPMKQIQESNKLQQKLKTEQFSNPPTLSTALMQIKNLLQGADVTFSQKSNIQSQLSCKILIGGLQEDRIKIKHRVVRDQWKFSDFTDSNQKLLAFEQWEKDYLATKYGANRDDIMIHKVTEGSIQAWISVNSKDFLLTNADFTKNQQVIVAPFFQAFNLSPDDFDRRGNYQFPNTNQTDLQYRAGIPYFQPIYGTRFGVNVSNKYDEGNDDWLKMDGNKNQWAVAFHGINCPGNKLPCGQKTVLQAIMEGRKKGEMLIAGCGQAYQKTYSINKPTIMVGRGIYCSPLFTTCLGDYTQPVTKNGLTYRVVLQCRIKPEALKCTSQTDYWVINQSKNIRPYGIVLLSQDHVYAIRKVNSSNSIYKAGWNWDSYKDKCKQFRDTHGLQFP